MHRELPSQEQPLQNEGMRLTSEFRSLKDQEQNTPTEVFKHLERDLFEAGFSLGAQTEVAQVLQNPALLCRSETFSRVVDLLVDSAPLTITNKGDANVCLMSGGSGFRVAMQEGFSGSDVGGVVKTVLAFDGDHLTERKRINKHSPLWDTKPDTASVSLSAEGEVLREDVRMVSFRFPIHYFPKEMLSELEQNALEESTVGFIVRHYIPMK